MKHIYSEQIKIGAYYSYNDKQQKVYDLKSMRQDFKALLEKLKSHCS